MVATWFLGKGDYKEAIPLICNYGFEKLGLHRIKAIIESENVAGKKVITNSGFEHEGTMKKCEFKNGKYINLDIYAKIAGTRLV